MRRPRSMVSSQACVLFFLLASACGTTTSSGVSEGSSESQTFADASREFDALVADSFVEHCGRVCHLRGVICEGASEICAAASSDPDDELAGARCRDADQRCVSATDTASELCGCGAR